MFTKLSSVVAIIATTSLFFGATEAQAQVSSNFNQSFRANLNQGSRTNFNQGFNTNFNQGYRNNFNQGYGNFRQSTQFYGAPFSNSLYSDNRYSGRTNNSPRGSYSSSNRIYYPNQYRSSGYNNSGNSNLRSSSYYYPRSGGSNIRYRNGGYQNRGHVLPSGFWY